MAEFYETENQRTCNKPVQETQPPDYQQFIRDCISQLTTEGHRMVYIKIIRYNGPLLISEVRDEPVSSCHHGAIESLSTRL